VVTDLARYRDRAYGVPNRDMTPLIAEPTTFHGPDLMTRRLLACGAVGGPLFLAVILVEGARRPGYSTLRDASSALAIGRDGWVQITNFIVCGLLMLAFAVGLRRALRPGLGSVAAPVLAGLYALGLIAAGVFVTDPGDGHPSGGPTGQHSWIGNAHNIASTVVFLALPVLCFVLAVRFVLRPGQRLWAAYSAATGVAVLALIQGLGIEGYGGLYQRLTIAVGWGWLAALALWLRGPRSRMAPQRQAAGTQPGSSRRS
jgi:hypothetical membrane protein